jgi:segregation and condensation protein A
MTDYRVNLDIFAGPLDLLLYLVRKEEVDIYDIPIARITDQYIHYVELIKIIDMDLAGSFIVMAATLMHIKSAMLLPKTETEGGEAETVIDPRSELIRQLLEYKKFKDAANLLDAAADEAQSRFGRPATILDQIEPNAEPQVDIDQVSIWDLLEAFDAICKATGVNPYINSITDETPIDLYQMEILARLQNEGALSFAQIFDGKPHRIVMIGIFLAVLELIRYGLVSIEALSQANTYQLKALTDEPPQVAVQRILLSPAEAESETQPQAPAETIQPPIPIVEIPAVQIEQPLIPVIGASAVNIEQMPIPIVELPAVGAAEKQTEEVVCENTELADSNFKQNSN